DADGAQSEVVQHVRATRHRGAAATGPTRGGGPHDVQAAASLLHRGAPRGERLTAQSPGCALALWRSGRDTIEQGRGIRAASERVRFAGGVDLQHVAVERVTV